MKTLLFSVLMSSMIPYYAFSQINVEGILINTTEITQDLDTPWEILWGPDDFIWMTERYGRISRINPETGEVLPLITINDVHEESESGLLGMALHPEFESNPYVYVVYNYFDGDINERVVRYTYEDETLSAPLILLDNLTGNRTHNGSRIRFGPDGKLYFSLGDASNASTAQDLESLNGKILRMNPNGSVPEDNPFLDSYVWSYGHRNPQGLIFSSEGMLYISEHGPQNDDEVNLIAEGANYGWPDVHGFCDETSETGFCTENNVVEPMAAWTPTLAVAGLEYYGDGPYTIWQNSLLLTSLKAGEMRSLQLSEQGESIVEQITWIDNNFGRLRDICVSPDGRVFIATSNRDGRGDPQPTDDRIIELIPDLANSVESQKQINNLHIAPNPVRNEFRLMGMESSTETYPVLIFNSSGQLLKSMMLNSINNSISVEGVPEGVYYLMVIAKNENLHLPFVVRY